MTAQQQTVIEYRIEKSNSRRCADFSVLLAARVPFFHGRLSQSDALFYQLFAIMNWHMVILVTVSHQV